ncbi:1-deoxy-D-xylulose-5-phosphate reductoisomerase [Ectothiorhodospira mobilis]|uniref:1-deoxy-D-xylulose-5-phosphate reductoisomerase n=1 Tax=Ectothiorhodospira mobilis TaxID=195064 RepID=UPI001908C1D8|nr:1-deoxy-D-xylulose-5-phosphate reductoisomerase [Ectothiorhodospira mobilis]MBK1692315.1 1-deoxy-D-xylulose-5-phosphate reductoisomerase [Ectothiorhodospira mobilis]
MSATPMGITVLGATGTIGVNTLDVVARHPGRYRVVALTAHANVERLVAQCRVHAPEFAVVADPAREGELAAALREAGLQTRPMAGPDALEEVARLPQTHCVMAAIVGGAGLLPSLAAARAGKRVLLANKEALVMSGRLFMDEIRKSGAELLPIDSEHNAIFQCMPRDFGDGLDRVGVERILLTASGGPFRDYAAEDLEAVTPEQACAHPNWVMGRKISVDSASMMNKGLELIEACWLFDTTPDKVEVVLHPQSVIHSMVSYSDGSVLAQLGNPDMRTPIAHALAWPERIHSGVDPLDIVRVGRLDFEAPDMGRFPCLRLAYEAFRAGGTATAILNAANEVAVEAFLQARVRFTDIPRVIEAALEAIPRGDALELAQILEADRAAREAAGEAVTRIGGAGRG